MECGAGERTLTPPKIVVHTDVFLEHLTAREHPSYFRRALGTYFCYTTVFQAIELFSIAQSSEERQAVEDTLSVVKILGVNGKSARHLAESVVNADRNTVAGYIAGVCLESRLPLLTWMRTEFSRFPGLAVVDPGSMKVPPHNSERVPLR